MFLTRVSPFPKKRKCCYLRNNTLESRQTSKTNYTVLRMKTREYLHDCSTHNARLKIDLDIPNLFLNSYSLSRHYCNKNPKEMSTFSFLNRISIILIN